MRMFPFEILLMKSDMTILTILRTCSAKKLESARGHIENNLTYFKKTLSSINSVIYKNTALLPRAVSLCMCLSILLHIVSIWKGRETHYGRIIKNAVSSEDGIFYTAKSIYF